MTLGIVNIPFIKNKLSYDNRISCRQFLLYAVININVIWFLCVVSLIIYLLLLAIIIQWIYCKNRIGNINSSSKLPTTVFQINSIGLIESEEFRETSNVCCIGWARNLWRFTFPSQFFRESQPILEFFYYYLRMALIFTDFPAGIGS